MGLATIKDMQYFVSNELLAHWEKITLKSMKKKNMDRVYVVDGRERIGKSTWTIQQAGVLDPAMFDTPEKFVSRICFTPNDFFNLVRTVENGVIIFDEAFRGFSSKSALSKVNKKLVQALMEMGQNNNIVFIVLPSILYLDRYAGLERADGLFNVYLVKKHGKRAWRGYNREDKDTLFIHGRKRSKKIKVFTRFRGNFYGKFPGGDLYEQAYLKKKRQALREMDSEVDKVRKKSREEENYLTLMNSVYIKEKSYRKVSDFLFSLGVEESHETIRKKLTAIIPQSQY